ncbi:acyl carrier protein [Bremerella cremea]|uniref:Carrier domain-containing protein n=1 Tax=Blastopirellula marina TaxID=124 RepID=A0A2S8G0A1_9BACT|nr:hypothetical protein C5Y83_07885 [Blastopirellula marina]RCS50241.1 acyl carrier protein [Bremerella cremea]
MASPQVIRNAILATLRRIAEANSNITFYENEPSRTLSEVQFDSLLSMDFVIGLEESLGVIIPPDEVFKDESVESLITLLKGRLAHESDETDHTTES